MDKRRNRRGQSQDQYTSSPYNEGFGSAQLYDDMSGYGGNEDSFMMNQQNMQYQQSPQQPEQSFPGQQFVNDPMANAALQYGSQFVPAGKDYVEKKLDHFMSVSKLKYYFAVDTAYVLKKLGLLIFPFTHQDWSLKYDNKTEPVAPRYEVNAPDLYIPTMAFVTYILVTGFILGTQDRFTPEQLGLTASSTLVWLFVELVVIIMSMYVIGILSNIRYLDILALCGYKYVGMILACLGGWLFLSYGYYLTLVWTSFAISFYLARTLRLVINPDQTDGVARASGGKRRIYTLLFISLIQPVSMYFLTRHLNYFGISAKDIKV